MSNRFPADDEHQHPYPGNLKHHKVDKAQQPVVTHMSIAPNASQETKAAVVEMVKAAYAYKPGNVLTDEKCKEIEQAWQQAHGADITHTMAFSDGLATARDYLAPAAGLTVDEAEECLVEHLAQYGPDWSAPARNRLRARLTAAINTKQKP